MADASQQPSDRRLAVEAQRGEGASRFPFLLTDDLRSPLDDLQRLRAVSYTHLTLPTNSLV